MPRVVLADRVLQAMRDVGDPELERALADADRRGPLDLDAVQQGGLRAAAAMFTPGQLAAGYKLARSATKRVAPDPTMLREAQRIFAQFAPEISGALLLAALPQSYATKFGARVLAATGGLEHDLVRRVRRTAQFLISVAQPAADDTEALKQWMPPDKREPVGVSAPQPWQLCIALRLHHHNIRRFVREQGKDFRGQPLTREKLDGEPLNQEDLLGILLTFSITVFEVLERYGISWSSDEQEAYLHLWDVIGAYLGIGSASAIAEVGQKVGRGQFDVVGWCGLRPPSIPDTRALLNQIRSRQWEEPPAAAKFAYTVGPVGPSSLTDGRLLVVALLDELSAAMPPMLKLLPITMMRTLNPDIVRQRLSLGHNGIVLRALDQLPRRRNIVDRFTSVTTPNPLAGRVLRSMANDVATRATVRFLSDPSFVIPGQEDWSRGFGRCR